MNSHIDETCDLTVTDMGDSISVFVPISWKRTGGRKQIILPDGASAGKEAEDKPPALHIALARAYVWQKAIDEGTYANSNELAKVVGLDASLVRRVMRLGWLSPRIVEGIMDGSGPDVQLQALMSTEVPVVWEEQIRSVGVGLLG